MLITTGVQKGQMLIKKAKYKIINKKDKAWVTWTIKKVTPIQVINLSFYDLIDIK